MPNEVEVMVKRGDYTLMEAIVANTRDDSYAIGLEDEPGETSAGKVADVLALAEDRQAGITALQGGGT